MSEIFKKYFGKKVLIDTDSRWVFIGTLKEEDVFYLALENVDAFDSTEVSLSKHEYSILVKKDGIAPNRKKTDILKSKIISITLLSNILDK